MKSFRLLLLGVASIAVLVAGCGGNEGGSDGTSVTNGAESSPGTVADPSPPPSDVAQGGITRDIAVDCLKSNIPAGGRISTEADEMKFYVENASDGGMTVYGPTAQINIAVEKSEDLAKDKESFIRGYIESLGASATTVFPVERRRNVVIQFSSPPGRAEKSLLDTCFPS